ncbi:MAG: glycosyltransferase family 2 protein [Halieaceae bacterium]
MTETVAILMPVHNGARFLSEQLLSITQQSFSDWALYCLDDGSTDESMEILRKAAVGDCRIQVLPVTSGGARGVLESVQRLLGHALVDDHSVFFLADQDDIWMSDKLEFSLSSLLALEGTRHGKPALISTDAELIDETGSLIAASYLRAMHYHRGEDALRDLLGRNYVQGCTVAFNRSLAELAMPLPAEAVMHDWWFGLCASAAGTYRYLPQASVKYRLHGENFVGHSGFLSGLVRSLTHVGPRWVAGQDELQRSITQAAALRRRLRERSIPVEAPTEVYADLSRKAPLARLLPAVRGEFRASNPILRLLFLLRLLVLPKVGVGVPK